MANPWRCSYKKYFWFQIMYFLGFAIFVLEALLSIWVFQVGLALTCR